MLTFLIIVWIIWALCRPWYGYWVHRPPMGGFGGWHRPPMGRHRPMGGFGGYRPPMGGFGGGFGGGGRSMGGGAGRGRR